MNCHDVQQMLEANGSPGGMRQAEAAQAHLRACPACRAFASDVRRLRRELADDDVPAMPPDLPARLRWRPMDAARPAGRLLAVAASLVLVIGLVLILHPWGEPGPAQPGVAASDEWRSETVTLSLDAPRDLHAVHIRIELPPRVEIEGHPGRRTLEWSDDLVAGPNQLRIPLLLTGDAEGELVATLRHGGRSRDLRIPVDGLR